MEASARCRRRWCSIEPSPHQDQFDQMIGLIWENGMRFGVGLAVAAGLVACSPPSPPTAEAPAFPESGETQVQLNVNEDLPQWLLIARQTNGGAIYWDRNSIVRNAESQAFVWARVEFDQNQVREAVSESASATTTQIVTYRITEVRYRFACAEQTFVITEQRYVDGDGTVAGAVSYAEGETGPPQAALPGTAGGLLFPIACQAVAQ